MLFFVVFSQTFLTAADCGATIGDVSLVIDCEGTITVLIDGKTVEQVDIISGGSTRTSPALHATKVFASGAMFTLDVQCINDETSIIDGVFPDYDVSGAGTYTYDATGAITGPTDVPSGGGLSLSATLINPTCGDDSPGLTMDGQINVTINDVSLSPKCAEDAVISVRLYNSQSVLIGEQTGGIGDVLMYPSLGEENYRAVATVVDSGCPCELEEIAQLTSLILVGPTLGTSSIACNSSVNVSLSPSCTATIQIGDVLRGASDPCANAAMMSMIDSIVLLSGGVVVAGSGSVAMPAIFLDEDLTAQFIGQPLTIQVVDTDPVTGEVNNLCWGNVILEDKSPPVVTCNDPGIMDISCLEFGPGSVMTTIDNLVEDCSTFSTTILAQSVITDCDNLPTNVLRRIEVTYFAEDIFNNRSNVCEDVIDVIRFDQNVGDGTLLVPGACVNFPPNFSINPDAMPGNRTRDGNVIKVPAEMEPLDCSLDFVRLDPDDPNNPAPAPLPLDMNGSGSPTIILPDGEGGNDTIILAAINYRNAPPSYQDLIDDNLASCGIAADFNDLVFNFGCEIKIIREWFLREWSCEGELTLPLGEQEITITDTQAPTFVTSSLIEDIVESVDSEQCSRSLTIPEPTAVDNCDLTGVNIGFSIFDMDGNLIGPNIANNVPQDIFDFPIGMSFIVYTAFDDCGNQVNDTTKVTISDGSAPVVICKEFLVIGISGDGNVRVPVTAIDNGTFDQCDLERVCVTRMDHLDLFLSLPSNGSGAVRFSVFDGALQDMAASGNTCFRDYSMESFLVGGVAFIDESALCTPYVDLCCEDVGNQGADGIGVQVTAFDSGGNSSRCWSFVELQDKNPAIVTCLTERITVDCNFEFPDIVRSVDNIADDPLSEFFGSIVLEGNQKNFGIPDEFVISPDPATNELLDGTIFDNCSIPRISVTVGDNRDECGRGNIIRNIFSNETGSPVRICRQIIRVESNVVFDVAELFAGIEEEISLEECITPEEVIRESFGTPNIADIEVRCSDLALETDNQVFFFNSDEDQDACFKVLRTFTVIDWCQSTPGNIFVVGTFTQVIKVSDPLEPVITCSPDLTGDNKIQTLDCDGGNVMLMAQAFDECTLADDHVWTGRVELDTDGDGFPDAFDSDIVILQTSLDDNTSKVTHSGFYPLGNHRIQWTVSDACGNVVTCTQNFTIANVKQPTPFAIDITTVLMPNSGMVEVWAADLDNGKSEGPCGQDITMSIVRTADAAGRDDGGFGISQPALTFTCADVGADGVDVNYFVSFDAGGDMIIFDFTTVNIVIQDNNDICSNVTTAFLTGSIFNDNQQSLPNVAVDLLQGGDMLQSVNTNIQGDYAFPAMDLGQSYTIDPSADDDHLNGVTTLDLILIQRHILGLQMIDSPYRIIAADINNDNRVSSTDLVDLRSVILGYAERFENNESWRFIDKNYQFTDPRFPLSDNLREQYNIATLNANMDIDFIGMKVGDINGSVEAASLLASSRSSYALEVSDVLFEEGDIVTMTLKASKDLDALGMQMALDFDPSMLSFAGLEAITLDISHTNIGTSSTREGRLMISWDEVLGQPVSSSDQLFTLQFRAERSGRLSETIRLNSDNIASEIYSTSLDVMNLNLEFGTTQSEAFTLYQNTPNPFSDNTLISFYLPAPTEVTLQISDITGKVIKNYTGSFDKGNNYIELSNTDLNASGVLYYTLSTGEMTDTKRMVVLK